LSKSRCRSDSARASRSGAAPSSSLRGSFLAGPQLMSYWLKEREKHERWNMAVRAMKR
jgi:hypothetical protein